ncbi:MAG: hypothetical protein IJR42_03745 [Paludibacteraceae bacterium]|nr:hypothetical protein [Paludibacteraceae bacterium]
MAEEGRTYNEVNHSMQRRCEGWDYKGRGIYMLTLVVRDRQPLLCSIEENESGVCAVATEIGRAVLEETKHITEIYKQIRILCRQIMPDHLHLLLFVEEALPVHLGKVVRGYKTGTNRAYGRILSATEVPSTGHREEREMEKEMETERMSGEKHGEGLSATEVPSTEHREEREMEKEMETERMSGEKHGEGLSATEVPSTGHREEREMGKEMETEARTGLWAEGYHDRILFHKGQLDALIHYIKDNPRRLALKRANPELFKIRQHLQIAGMSFTAMGNIFLADYPQKAVIQCSRKLHHAEIDAKKAECLDEAAKGMVFVSAAISEGEKQICRAVREAGHPIVVLLEKGFPKPEDQNYKYFKPKGVYFEACAAGKLLLLEPEKELYEQAEIEAEVVAKAGNIPHEALRYRFLALNAIVERICGEERTPATEVPDTEHR